VPALAADAAVTAGTVRSEPATTVSGAAGSTVASGARLARVAPSQSVISVATSAAPTTGAAAAAVARQRTSGPRRPPRSTHTASATVAAVLVDAVRTTPATPGTSGTARAAATAIAATVDNLSLAAVHAEPVSNWKGISPAITGMRAVYITLLAGRGITGPRALFDGPNGLEQLFDQRIDMHTEDTSLNIVECTYLKQYCSLIHGQAVIDATLALRSEHQLTGAEVDSVTVEVFQGAYDFAGGGSYGGKDLPTTKEQADYNLKYLTAVALLDGQVGPEQLENDRIMRPDVQRLLARVVVKPASDLTAAYPERTSTRVHALTTDGRTFSREQSDFEGSPTSPMSWERVVEKFEWLGEPFADCSHRAEIASAVQNLDQIPVSQFADLLAGVSSSARRPRSRGRL